jgi:peptidoglycan hydrolase-like protein with peptidoglycan-binding domain
MREKIISLAQNELGYKEGKNNENKYGAEYGMNNQPWCCIFVYLMYLHAGFQLYKTASCGIMIDWLKQNGKFKDKSYLPKVGDLIFFDWEANGRVDHVGLVEKVEGNTVITIEGNRSDAVGRYTYSLDNKTIFGYGVVLDEASQNSAESSTNNEVILPVVKKGSKGDIVKTVQSKLIEKGYNLSKYGADGDFGAETEEAVKEFQKNNNLIIDGIIGKNTWTKLNDSNTPKASVIKPWDGIYYGINRTKTGVKDIQTKLNEKGFNCGNVDGIAGTKFDKAVKEFQKANNLSADGIVGKDTWNKLFN